MQEISFDITLDETIEAALDRLTAALKAEGFGILTRIDVQATMKEKLGEDFRPYLILGVCNPPLALKALSTDGSVGLMLPCNVTLESDSSNKTLIRIANPEIMIQFGEWRNNPALGEVAEQAHLRLKRAAAALAN